MQDLLKILTFPFLILRTVLSLSSFKSPLIAFVKTSVGLTFSGGFVASEDRTSSASRIEENNYNLI